VGWIRCLTLGFAIALLVGGGATINEATTLESLASAGKAGVVMHVDMGTCFTTQVYIGRQSGDVYKPAAMARSGSFLDTSPMIRAELDPGEYHIVKLICTIGNHSTVLGRGSWGSFTQSLGRFEVRAGEIVNIGSLHVVPVSGKDVHLAVSDIPETEFNSARIIPTSSRACGGGSWKCPSRNWRRRRWSNGAIASPPSMQPIARIRRRLASRCKMSKSGAWRRSIRNGLPCGNNLSLRLLACRWLAC